MSADRSSKSGVMLAITLLTAIYVIALATMTARASSVGNLNGVIVAEAMFASPMLIAYALSRWLVRRESRIVLLVFEIAFLIFTCAVFYHTFTGEHDAQYQLKLLIIPFVGFPAIVIAGAIAALVQLKRHTDRAG